MSNAGGGGGRERVAPPGRAFSSRKCRRKANQFCKREELSMNDASGPVPIDFSLLLFFCFVNPIVFFAFVAGYFARRGL